MIDESNQWMRLKDGAGTETVVPPRSAGAEEAAVQRAAPVEPIAL